MQEKIKEWDEYTLEPSLKLTRDKDSLGSYMGTCLTALLYVITSVFLYDKYIVLKTASDITILRNVRNRAFTFDDQFTGENNNLFLAAALTKYDGDTESIERPEYGELKISIWRWGFVGGIGSGETILDHHTCSDEELGLTDSPDSVTFPLVENSFNEVNTWKKKFKCVDKEQLSIQGDYNSAKAQQFSFSFKMCEGEGCKTKEEIIEWLRGKYIVMLYN